MLRDGFYVFYVIISFDLQSNCRVKIVDLTILFILYSSQTQPLRTVDTW